jgi:hypothetical protein
MALAALAGLQQLLGSRYIHRLGMYRQCRTGNTNAQH